MINSEVIADSICARTDVRIATVELVYPRFIHAEFMTHRLFSRNAASSRAIPVDRMIDLVEANPAYPIHWGANQSGMQARRELSEDKISRAKFSWDNAMQDAVLRARELKEIGAHKQIVNRILEPFQLMKTVMTATELANFLWLRDHDDAQPEIHALAIAMRDSLDRSTPRRLHHGEWHLPYVTDEDKASGDLESCLALSVSCCAQVSYRKLDKSIDKATRIRDMLTSSDRIHASPFEHQATPMPLIDNRFEWPDGVTHRDRNGSYWSGNFRNWIQHRKLIANEAVW